MAWVGVLSGLGGVGWGAEWPGRGAEWPGWGAEWPGWGGVLNGLGGVPLSCEKLAVTREQCDGRPV